MNISAPFIQRPVATILLAIALIGAGLFAYRYLPVAALPNVDFPIITVSGQLPGASPDTMANSVATPLIKQFSTIPAIQSITATSVQGSTQIVIQFDLNRDIDQAAADVQAAIARTLRQLPANMTTPPSYRKVNPADAPIVLLALQSKTMALPDLDNFAEDVISPALSQLDGVGEVQVFGAKKFAVRAEVNPTAISGLGIGIDTITNAVASANSIAPVGTLAGPSQNLAIQTNTQMTTAKQFGQIILASPNGKPVRLDDVSRVIDSVANTQTTSSYDGSVSLVLAVFRQPDANTVDVVKRVKAMLPSFVDDLGPSGSLNVLNDRSQSIVQAVSDVELTLLLTIGLVALVIFLFLRRVSATIIPTLAVPISLIATFAVMYVLGYSIDNISLLGLTLAVGLVVDDAIVMLENIVRHIEEGVPPFEAALKGSREVGFTIVSITISLVAVFLPVLLMGGVVGRIFNEFAMVVTISIVASSLVSLTLTPMLCARLPANKSGRHHAEDEAPTGWLVTGYRVALDFCSLEPWRSAPSCLLFRRRASCPRKTLASSPSARRRVRTFRSTIWPPCRITSAKFFRQNLTSPMSRRLSAAASAPRRSTPVACSSSSNRRTPGLSSPQSLTTCASRSAPFPAFRASSRRCRTCVSAARRRRASISLSSRASIATSCSTGRRSSRTRWVATSFSPTLPLMFRITRRRPN
jgi:HAE1 family hydrophobic/amphiphilic exporter-1